MKVLIIEDEEQLAQSMKKGFEKMGFAADYLLDGDSGQKRIEVCHNDYDIVILDIKLPKKDGLEVCRKVRQLGIKIPILMLTASDTTEKKIQGLDSGADDYLVKPFSFDELLARVRALLRRPSQTLPPKLHVGDITLDPANREVHRNGKKINLSLKEFELLAHFMRNPGRVLNREDIFSHLWDFADNSMSNVIDVHIKNLRKKINDKEGKKLLETIRGVGYRLKV
jgi:DNA-binding response OmpR family regulator